MDITSMAEQNVCNSTDIPSTSNIMKDINPLEMCDENSLIRRSISNEHYVPVEIPPSTMTATASTGSRVIYCFETDNAAQSIRRQSSIATSNVIPVSEDPVLCSDGKFQALLQEIRNRRRVSDSDNDSFDDEDETIITDSLHSRISTFTSNTVMETCPICFEPAVLQMSLCCSFRYCHSCSCAHISATINDGRIKIPCLSNDCQKYLTRESIVNSIRRDTLLHERYLRFCAHANQNPRAKICPRCSHLYSLDETTPFASMNNSKKSQVKINNKKIPKQVQCSECSLVWCFRCSAPWHENITCKQFAKGDKMLLKWINQKNEDQWNARKCPKCSSFIQRAGGCPHMTCSSCACQFCYLCGRRYCKIPFVGQHSNKFSMFGCPYNLHPEKPWLRRTIRGTIATGLVVASPVILVGAATAAVTVLPTFGIYRLIKYARARRRTVQVLETNTGEDFMFDRHFMLNQELLETVTVEDTSNNDEIASYVTQFGEELHDMENNNDTFPLSIFADMDVENLFSEYRKTSAELPTMPAINLRKSHSLDNLTTINHPSTKRHHSVILKH